MDSIDQKIRIGTCRAKTNFEEDWSLLQIGTKYFHTFSEFKEEFGPTDKKLLGYLCAYYSAENPVNLADIIDTKAKTALIAFLTKRKDAIRAGEEFKNNSFYGKQPHTFVAALENDIKKLKGEGKGKGEGQTEVTEEPNTRQTVSKDVLIKQFFKGLYILILTKGDKIQISKDYDELIKDLDELTLDEALGNTYNILKKTDLITSKTKQNSLMKYITDETLSKDSSTVKDNKSKLDIIKLITLFKTGKVLNGLNGVKTNTKKLDSYFDGIATNLPHMVEDILLTYRSFTRFYRARYTTVMVQFGKLMNTVGLDNYPIELMIQLVFIMYNMMRYVNKDNLSERYRVFKKNEGLLRFTQNETTSEYSAILNLLNTYQEHFEDISKTDNIIHELLTIHAQNKKEVETPILQLVSGKNILINNEKLTAKLKQLDIDKKLEIPDSSIRSNIFSNLRKEINSFFENKDTTLYIIYQLTPENLTKTGSAIKQLNGIQCIMANITDTLETAITDDDSSSELDITIPRSIEGPKEIPRKKQEIRDLRKKEILYNLTSGNTFADFGITIKTPLELTQSITNITATLLNSQYLNNKLKAINKKLKDV